ncbi:glutaredoxin family protein [Candidatus Micrarchaeota archaeon]|nr:glutaredoxin family protein [Candidatus Micrarchaeota archaeon]
MKNVIVYTTKTCVYCNATKEFLKNNSVQFKEVDVGVDQKAAEEMFEKSGQVGVPVVEIEGTIIIGYDKDAMREELGL